MNVLLLASSRAAPGLWSSSSVSRPKACAGEPISVDVQLENPLEINLQLKRLSLRCHFAPDDAEDGADEAMLVEELDMVLHGRSKALARLSVVTHKPGNLRIDGVRWTLDGVAEGSADFSMRLPVKKRSGKAPLDAPRGGFAVKVMAASPRLDLELLDPSVSLLAGEIAQGSLILRNSGAVPLRDLRLATASPINVSLLEASDTSGRLDSSFDAASHISTFQLVGSKLEPGESIALGVVFWCVTGWACGARGVGPTMRRENPSVPQTGFAFKPGERARSEMASYTLSYHALCEGRSTRSPCALEAIDAHSSSAFAGVMVPGPGESWDRLSLPPSLSLANVCVHMHLFSPPLSFVFVDFLVVSVSVPFPSHYSRPTLLAGRQPQEEQGCTCWRPTMRLQTDGGCVSAARAARAPWTCSPPWVSK